MNDGRFGEDERDKRTDMGDIEFEETDYSFWFY